MSTATKAVFSKEQTFPASGASEQRFSCFPIKTHVITAEDKLDEVVRRYVKPFAQKGDIVFLSEKMVACTQGRAIPLAEIKPGFWARLLSRFVVKAPTGIGLAMPETMQCAIDECGLPRILLAAAAGMAGKILRQKGWFYHVAGPRAATIDGPCHWTIPPYNSHVVLMPLDPSGVAAGLSTQLGGSTVLVVDINDLGGNILGSAGASFDQDTVMRQLRHNPLGQSCESTPIGILRPEG